MSFIPRASVQAATSSWPGGAWLLALHLAFGDRVRAARRQAGLSQEKLGELAGLHRTYIGHVERGEVNPTLTSLVRIARALGVDAADLLRAL